MKRSSNGNGVNFEFDERDDGTVSFSDKNSPVRRNSHSSSMLDNASLTTQGGNVLTVKATVNKGEYSNFLTIIDIEHIVGIILTAF